MSAATRVSRWMVIGLVGLLLSIAAEAQTTPEQKPSPGATSEDLVAPIPPPAAVDYFFPDLGATALVHDGKYFWFRPIFAIVGDYTWFSQNDASVQQVGTQDNTPEMRAVRLGGTFRSKGTLKWEFYATVDYQERRNREGALFQLYDLQLRIPMGPVKVTIGKQKELIGYEMVGLSVLLPQQERILLPFFPSRNIGVNFSGPLAGGRMFWSAGAFNDWLETGADFKTNARDFVGRLSALAYESPDKTEYVHLGIGARNVGPDEGMMRFSGRPESNVTDKYVDTKEFPANGANVLSFEALWSHGPFSILAEDMNAWVDAPDSGNPTFYGYYVAGSWVVTGENRPYVRAGGFAGGILPRRRFGAVELVAKYSRLDLTNGAIDGGVLGKWNYGVNWWASAQWKVGLSYGDANLDKGGIQGNTKMWLTRVQWLW